MAKVYYDLIKKDYRTIDDVPERWRADVAKLIEEAKSETNEVEGEIIE